GVGLWDRGAEKRRARRSAPHRGSRPPIRRSDLSRRRADDVQGRRKSEGALERTRSLEAVHLRSAATGRRCGCRSGPGPAPRRQPDKQLADPCGERQAGRDEVVAEMDGVAAGPAAVVWNVRMTAMAALVEGIRRVNRAPAVLAGVWIVSMVMTLPMALALRAMIEQHLGS